MAPKVISVANRKGGVGKTTVAVTVGHGLARKGKRVLLIDLDAQGTVSRRLGIEQDDGAFNLLSQDLGRERNVEFVRSLVVETGRENFWVLPGSDKTEQAQQQLYHQSPHFLRGSIERVFFNHVYDYIILDTMPSKHALQEQPIWASDYLLIPITPEQGALDGLELMWAQLTEMLKNPNPEMRWSGSVLGIEFNEYEVSGEYLTKATRDTMEIIKASFPEELILGPIHRSQIFIQNSGIGKTIYETANTERAIKEYDTILKVILSAK